VAGAGRASTPCLLGEGRPEPRSLLKVVWSSLVESPIMAHNGDGGPLRDEPMKVASKSFLRGERLRPLTQLVMNSRLPNRMVSPRERPPHIKRSLSVEMASTDDGTIRTSRGKARYKSPFLACQLLIFLHRQDIGWSRLHVPVLRWSCE
jgi:hypothetical protein